MPRQSGSTCVDLDEPSLKEFWKTSVNLTLGKEKIFEYAKGKQGEGKKKPDWAGIKRIV